MGAAFGPWPHLSAAAFTPEAVVTEPRDLEPSCVSTRFDKVCRSKAVRILHDEGVLVQPLDSPRRWETTLVVHSL